MIEDEGDLWEYPAQYRAITTNGIINKYNELVMGAGIALQAKERYPQLPLEWGRCVFAFGNIPHVYKPLKIISFPTKHHWKQKSDIELIIRSANHITKLATSLEMNSIVMTRPGCGCGGLVWADVRKEIEPILDDRFIILC